ncbi:hypothetical protein ACFVWR_05780 [Leifsonia sp. NPDC058292]|uniref:hypothetical protein n=1 Tax=Leifsonia sp. NPDC058292 TaxID=3346428 RepID=UPI0036D9DFB2
MKFLIFVAGVGVGFVLGSKAGRQAYDRIKHQVDNFTQSSPVQQVKSDVKDLAGKAAGEAGDRVSDVIDKASDKLDDLTGKSSGSASTAS